MVLTMWEEFHSGSENWLLMPSVDGYRRSTPTPPKKWSEGMTRCLVFLLAAIQWRCRQDNF